MDDAELLRRYADQRSEDAFRELVGRHVDLVYGAALRQVGGDSHLAGDVAQKVFVALARKARTLRDRRVLVGWLYTSTRLEAAQLLRSERRRRDREGKAYFMNALLSGDSGHQADWGQLRPVLDEAMTKLGDADREAVLLRFFSGQSFAEVGQNLQVSEEAARKRVDRALEKLRKLLGRQGLASTSGALGILLSQQASAAAPTGIAAAIAAGAWGEVAAGTAAGVGASFATFMTGSKLMAGIAGAVLALAAGWTVKDAVALRSAMQRIAPLEGQSADLVRQRDEVNRRVAASDREVAAREALLRSETIGSAPNARPKRDRELLQAQANLIGRHLQYARMFRQLNLSPEKARELESIMDRENGASGMAGELHSEIHQLLGDEGMKQYYDFKRSVALHNVVDTISTNAYAGSEPYTAAQSDQLFDLLIANDPNYQNGHGTDVSHVNWAAVWEPASKVLSPNQLNYFQATVEAQVLKMQVQVALRSGQGAGGQ